jgi:hypothetical protein
MFISYPSEHKGYRCVDLATNKVITSHHVLFDEFTFPLATHKICPNRPHHPLPARDPGEYSLNMVPV